jgi:hypothetical protein
MPIYKESLQTVLAPSILSLKILFIGTFSIAPPPSVDTTTHCHHLPFDITTTLDPPLLETRDGRAL